MKIKDKERLLLIILLGSVAAIGPFTVDMYLPGFPEIIKDLNASEAEVAYTLTAYFFGISVGQLFYGPIVDKFGRKPPLIVGLIIYFLSSLGCALSYSVEVLIIFRLFQALGASVGMVSSQAMIRDKYGAREVAKMLSSILLVMGVAPIIAPTFGSFLVAAYSWESIFYFLMFVSGFIILGLIFFLQETQGYNKSYELKIKPVFKKYFKAFKNKKFLDYTLAGSLTLSIMFAYVAVIPLIIINIYGLNETQFGLLFSLNAGGFILGSQINRFLLQKFQLRYLTRLAAFIQLIFTIVFLICAFLIDIPFWLFCVLIFSILFFIGFTNPNSIALALESFDRDAGTASALNGSIRMGMAAIVTATMGRIYDGTPFYLILVIFILSLSSFFFLWKAGYNMQ